MVYLLMAVIQIVYVSLNSFRVVLMIKGKKYLASGISMVEIFVYISGLTLVLPSSDDFGAYHIQCYFRNRNPGRHYYRTEDRAGVYQFACRL